MGGGSLWGSVDSSLLFSNIHVVFIHTTLSGGGCSDRFWYERMRYEGDDARVNERRGIKCKRDEI